MIAIETLTVFLFRVPFKYAIACPLQVPPGTGRSRSYCADSLNYVSPCDRLTHSSSVGSLWRLNFLARGRPPGAARSCTRPPLLPRAVNVLARDDREAFHSPFVSRPITTGTHTHRFQRRAFDAITPRISIRIDNDCVNRVIDTNRDTRSIVSRGGLQIGDCVLPTAFGPETS